MRIIGLTGSIAMGKSTAAKMLRARHIPVFDSDKEVHDLLTHNPHLRQQIATFFPESYNSAIKTLDRQKLGALVFQNPAQRQFLESLVHPYIWQAQNRFLLKARRAGCRAVILDIPLLFETRRNSLCNAVICLTAPPFLQKLRALARPGMTRAKLSSILRGQMPSRSKEHLSDYTLKSGLGFRFTQQKIVRILQSILKDKI